MSDQGPPDPSGDEIDLLRRRLIEAQETLDAIRTGGVDAFLVSEPDGERVYTLESADRPYRVLVESMQQGALTLTPDGTILYCNPRLATLLGTPSEQLISRQLLEIVPPAEHAAWNRLLSEARAGAASSETRLLCADGAPLPVHVTLSPLPMAEAGAICALFTDLTERKHYEELQRTQAALQKSEAAFRAMANSVPVVVWTAAPDGATNYVSDRWADYTGQPPAQSGDWSQVLHQDDRQRCLDQWAQSLRDATPFQIEVRFRRYDGAYRYWYIRAIPIRDAAGRISAWFGSSTDIHELKLAERDRLHLAAIVEDSEDAIISKDLDGVIQSWNVGAQRLFGYTAAEAIGRSILILIPKERQTEEREILSRLRRGQRIDHFETARMAKDGRLLEVSLTVSPIRDQSGKLTGVSKIARDISKTKAAERALRESQQRLRIALESGRMGTWDWDIVSGRTTWSPALEAIHGLAPGSFGGTFEAFQSDIHPDDLPRVLRNIRESLQTRTEHRAEYRILPPSGRTVWVETRGRLTLDDRGHPIQMSGVCMDITERREAEQSLRDSERRYRQLVELLPVGVFTVDTRAAVTFFNRHAVELWGREPGPHDPADTFLASTRLLRLDGAPLAQEQSPLDAALRTATSTRDAELIIERPDGSRVIVRLNTDPIHDSAGAVTGAISVFYNITERRRAEEQARARALQQETVARLGHIALASTDMGALMNETTVLAARTLGTEYARVMHLQPGGATLQVVAGCGWNPATARNASVSAAPGTHAALVLSSPAPVVIDDLRRETRFTRPGMLSEHGVVSGISVIIAGPARTPFGILGAHTTSRRTFSDDDVNFLRAVANILAAALQRQHARLEEAEQAARLDAVVNTAADGIITFDQRGVIETVNPAFERIFGYPASELTGRSITALIPHAFPPRADGTPGAAGPDDLIDRDRQVEGRRKDGAVFPVDMAVSSTRLGNRRIFTGIVRDITERKAVEEELARHQRHLEQLVADRTQELQSSHERLRLSERLAAIGTLGAGLGHDMGNLLMPLLVRLGSLEAMGLPDAARQELAAIRSSAGYLQKLAGGLRTLAIDPRDAVRGEDCELHQWWEEALPVLRNVLPRGVKLDSRFPEAPCSIKMSRAALMQVVFNLVQNAGDALKAQPRGLVTVSAEPRGSVVALTISDNGPGMTETVRRRCMEPFFTTKARGVSTGLGLAIVYGLLREAGGQASIESVLGEGTTFTLLLPAADAPSADAPRAPRIAVVSLHDKRLQAFVTAELQHLGFEVTLDGAGATAPRVDLAVVDSLSDTTASRPARTILVGEPPRAARADLVVLGPRPKPNQMREALRTWAAAAALGDPPLPDHEATPAARQR